MSTKVRSIKSIQIEDKISLREKNEFRRCNIYRNKKRETNSPPHPEYINSMYLSTLSAREDAGDDPCTTIDDGEECLTEASNSSSHEGITVAMDRL